MKGTLFAFIGVALFSLYCIFGKLLLNNVSPYIILILNQTLAAAILILILDLSRKIKEIKQTSKHDFKSMYVISIFSAVAGPLLFLIGLKFTTATNSVLIGKAESVLTSLLAVFFLKDRITKHQIIGTIVMFSGIFVLATNGFSIGLKFNTGDILIFASAASYAVGTILFKKYMHHIPPEVIVTLRALFGASMLFLISLFFIDYSSIVQMLSIKFVLTLLGLVVFTTILGQYFWYKALETTTATKVSLAGMSSPLIAIIYTTLLLGEKLHTPQISGGLLIIAGLIILEFHFRKTHTEKKHIHHLKLKHWPHI